MNGLIVLQVDLIQLDTGMLLAMFLVLVLVIVLVLALFPLLLLLLVGTTLAWVLKTSVPINLGLRSADALRGNKHQSSLGTISIWLLSSDTESFEVAPKRVLPNHCGRDTLDFGVDDVSPPSPSAFDLDKKILYLFLILTGGGLGGDTHSCERVMEQ